MTRRGVATIMAVVLIGVMAVTLTAVSAAAVAEQRRAALAAGDAQASQLLAAVARIATQQVAENRPVEGAIETPLGWLTLTWNGTTSCAVDVVCPYGSRHATLVFERQRLVRVE